MPKNSTITSKMKVKTATFASNSTKISEGPKRKSLKTLQVNNEQQELVGVSGILAGPKDDSKQNKITRKVKILAHSSEKENSPDVVTRKLDKRNLKVFIPVKEGSSMKLKSKTSKQAVISSSTAIGYSKVKEEVLIDRNVLCEGEKWNNVSNELVFAEAERFEGTTRKLKRHNAVCDEVCITSLADEKLLKLRSKATKEPEITSSVTEECLTAKEDVPVDIIMEENVQGEVSLDEKRWKKRADELGDELAFLEAEQYKLKEQIAELEAKNASLWEIVELGKQVSDILKSQEQ